MFAPPAPPCQWSFVNMAISLTFYILAAVGLLYRAARVPIGGVKKKPPPKQRLLRLLRPHADKRREAMFAYVYRLVNAPPDPQLTELRRIMRHSETNVVRRMELEEELQKRVRKERSSAYQIKAVVKGLMGDVRPRHPPTRRTARGGGACAPLPPRERCVGPDAAAVRRSTTTRPSSSRYASSRRSPSRSS